MTRLAPCLAAILIGVGAAAAEAQHIDILTYDDNGTIGTGFIDFDTGQPTTGQRLFSETFDQVLPVLYGTTAPGFFNSSSLPLLPLEDLSFDALAITHPNTQIDANLLYWDGLGPVNFGAPGAGTTVQFRLSSSTNISVDGSPSDVPGFVLEGTGPTGLLHKHISYSARGPGGTQPADGLYLTSIQLNMPGLVSSDPVYLLFNAHYQRDVQNNIVFLGDAPQVDENSEALAVTWIEQNLLSNALPGDLDGDGFVGIDDLNLVLGNWNQNVPPADPLADPSGDGFIGIDDLNEVLGNWNAGTPPGSTGTVPEPGTALLLAAASIMGVSRRR